MLRKLIWCFETLWGKLQLILGDWLPKQHSGLGEMAGLSLPLYPPEQERALEGLCAQSQIGMDPQP